MAAVMKVVMGLFKVEVFDIGKSKFGGIGECLGYVSGTGSTKRRWSKNHEK